MTEDDWTEDTGASAPAGQPTPKGAPPATAGAEDDGGTGVPAGSPMVEPDPDNPPDDATVMLQIDPATDITEFQLIDATVVAGEYRAFTPQQASALIDSAHDAGVVLINQADEEGTGGTP